MAWLYEAAVDDFQSITANKLELALHTRSDAASIRPDQTKRDNIRSELDIVVAAFVALGAELFNPSGEAMIQIGDPYRQRTR